MRCPECKGIGWVSAETQVNYKAGDEDWSYEDVPCGKCKGKGYLTPEEQGLDKF